MNVSAVNLAPPTPSVDAGPRACPDGTFAHVLAEVSGTERPQDGGGPDAAPTRSEPAGTIPAPAKAVGVADEHDEDDLDTAIPADAALTLAGSSVVAVLALAVPAQVDAGVAAVHSAPAGAASLAPAPSGGPVVPAVVTAATPSPAGELQGAAGQAEGGETPSPAATRSEGIDAPAEAVLLSAHAISSPDVKPAEMAATVDASVPATGAGTDGMQNAVPASSVGGAPRGAASEPGASAADAANPAATAPTSAAARRGSPERRTVPEGEPLLHGADAGAVALTTPQVRAGTNSAVSVEQAGAPVPLSALAGPLVRTARTVRDGGVHMLEIRLDPAELGHVTIEARLHGNAVDLKLIAQSPVTVRALEAAADRLRAEVGSAGVELGSLTVAAGGPGAGSGSGANSDRAPSGSDVGGLAAHAEGPSIQARAVRGHTVDVDL